MALYLAGLRTIPDELREAARVDGASRFQIYRYVELPMLTPITVSAIVILGHIALKIFDLIFAMAGPDHAPTSVPAITMFLKTFRGNEFAVGSAIGVVLLVLVSLLIIPYVSTSFREGRSVMPAKGATRVFVQALALLLAVVYLIPVYMTIVTSLKSPKEISHLQAWSLPASANWGSYSIAFRRFAPYLKNSFVLAAVATMLSASMGAINGYVMSSAPFPGSRVVMPLIVFGMLSIQSVWCRCSSSFQKTRLYGGLPGLIVVHVVYGLPITTLLFRSFYAEIPDELLGAARIDRGRICRHIPLPHTSLVRAPVPGGGDMAIHADMERVSVRGHAGQAGRPAYHGRPREPRRRARPCRGTFPWRAQFSPRCLL